MSTLLESGVTVNLYLSQKFSNVTTHAHFFAWIRENTMRTESHKQLV